ncbi:TPA: hypothetical protein EYP12_00465 [Candidatus Bipolaricaulota bacterium]|nr:hypothetical protein [Candidatus Bipolaricaulota bacterium]
MLELDSQLEKIERQRQELRREQRRTQDFQQRMELRKKIFELDKQYNRKVEEIQNKRRQLFTEKERQIKALEASAELKVEQELVGISEWRLL